jgi:hypothetical protein
MPLYDQQTQEEPQNHVMLMVEKHKYFPEKAEEYDPALITIQPVEDNAEYVYSFRVAEISDDGVIMNTRLLSNVLSKDHTIESEQQKQAMDFGSFSLSMPMRPFLMLGYEQFEKIAYTGLEELSDEQFGKLFSQHNQAYQYFEQRGMIGSNNTIIPRDNDLLISFSNETTETSIPFKQKAVMAQGMLGGSALNIESSHRIQKLVDVQSHQKYLRFYPALSSEMREVQAENLSTESLSDLIFNTQNTLAFVVNNHIQVRTAHYPEKMFVDIESALLIYKKAIEHQIEAAGGVIPETEKTQQFLEVLDAAIERVQGLRDKNNETGQQAKTTLLNTDKGLANRIIGYVLEGTPPEKLYTAFQGDEYFAALHDGYTQMQQPQKAADLSAYSAEIADQQKTGLYNTAYFNTQAQLQQIAMQQGIGISAIDLATGNTTFTEQYFLLPPDQQMGEVDYRPQARAMKDQLADPALFDDKRLVDVFAYNLMDLYSSYAVHVKRFPDNKLNENIVNNNMKSSYGEGLAERVRELQDYAEAVMRERTNGALFTQRLNTEGAIGSVAELWHAATERAEKGDLLRISGKPPEIDNLFYMFTHETTPPEIAGENGQTPEQYAASVIGFSVPTEVPSTFVSEIERCFQTRQSEYEVNSPQEKRQQFFDSLFDEYGISREVVHMKQEKRVVG